MPKKNAAPVFKEYTMGQMVLLPVDFEEAIEPDHLVRVVHAAVDKLDLRQVYAQYAGGGASSYHPKMMLEVLIYAYSQQIFSSRKIAEKRTHITIFSRRVVLPSAEPHLGRRGIRISFEPEVRIMPAKWMGFVCGC